MSLAALYHPAHAAMIPAGYGAGIGRVGRFLEQGNWYRGGAQQMLFTSWLYWVQNDRIRPTFPEDAAQEELFNHVRKHASDPVVRENQYLIIAPTGHCGYRRVSARTVIGERPDEFLYDPSDPVISLGGNVCCTGGALSPAGEKIISRH